MCQLCFTAILCLPCCLSMVIVKSEELILMSILVVFGGLCALWKPSFPIQCTPRHLHCCAFYVLVNSPVIIHFSLQREVGANVWCFDFALYTELFVEKVIFFNQIMKPHTFKYICITLWVLFCLLCFVLFLERFQVSLVYLTLLLQVGYCLNYSVSIESEFCYCCFGDFYWFLFVYFCCWNRDLPCSPGCRGTYCADQADLGLTRSSCFCLPRTEIKGVMSHCTFWH